MSKYSEKFKDPRWKKRRLEILERDDWSCQCCGTKERTLNVHHRWYEKGKDPWDYSDECLVTFCEGCHENEHLNRHDTERDLLTLLNKSAFDTVDLEEISQGLIDRNFFYKPELIAVGLNLFLSKPDMQKMVLGEWVHEYVENGGTLE